MSHPSFPNLTVLDHPLIQHKVTRLRATDTGTRNFKALVTEIAMLMAYEATKELPVEDVAVTTPLETTTGKQVAGKKLALVPILRAGLGMVDGVSRMIPNARVGHIGLYRDHDSLKPVPYYFKIPNQIDQRLVLVLDPMLATGGSAAHAITELKHAGAKNLRTCGFLPPHSTGSSAKWATFSRASATRGIGCLGRSKFRCTATE